jgi:hypothetical protein
VDSKPGHPEGKQLPASPKPERLQVLREDHTEKLRLEMESVIRDHAYGLYQNAGQVQGRDLGHWVEAEAKLISSNLEVRASGPWFHCNCNAPAIPAQQIQVAIDATQFIVRFQGDIPPNPIPSDTPYPTYYWAKWPEKVDPYTAAAYLLDSHITIEVKKSDPPEPNGPVKPVNNPIS